MPVPLQATWNGAVDMKSSMSAIVAVVGVVLSGNARKATKYLDANMVVTATSLDWYRGKPPRKNARSTNIRLKIGRPNFSERKFIKLCKKQGRRLV